MSNKKSLFLLIFLLLTLFSSLGLALKITIFSGKATGSNVSPITLENSYLFASPLQAKADSKEQIRITVFLLDGRGLGVANQLVTLNLPSTISINPTQPTTDDTGKAVFDLSSPTTQKIEVSAVSSGKTLPQKVKITFY